MQCAPLVNINHDVADLIMNECAYSGQGHTIHSSGQTEWSYNSVDDKSIQVGGKQIIIIIDGYTMSLVSHVFGIDW